MLPQLRAGLNRNGTLFDDQAVSGCTFCNSSRDSFDGGEIRIAIGQWRRSHADEDRISPSNCFFRGPEMQSASVSNAIDNVLEMRLKKRRNSTLQLREFFDVGFTAEDVVADLCQASRGCETNVACADDRQFHSYRSLSQTY